MLTPEYLEGLPEPVLELIRAMEDAILVKMAARIAKYGWTEQSQWEKDRLEAVGVLQSEIVRIVARYAGTTQKAVLKLMAEAGAETVLGDKPFYAAAGKWSEEKVNREAINKIINAGLKRTGQTFRNLTGTLAKETAKEFTYAMDKAFLAASTGTIDPQTAGRRAIHELCQKGITTVSYPSGHVDNVEVAVRRALVTGINQTAMHTQIQLAKDLDCDLVEVTAHAGARPEHAVWQGKVFSLFGKTPGYSLLSAATGYGTGEGLGGWNCRHNFHPFFPGFTPAYTEEQLAAYNAKKYTYNGKQLTEYEAMEQQRYFERGIRRWKREYVAVEAGGYDTTEAAVRLKAWREKEADFLRQTGRQRDSSRSQIGTFGRSEAGKATWAAKKAFENPEDYATIKAISGARITNQFGAAAKAHADRYYGLVRSMTTDVKRIADNTGFSEADIAKIKKFIFLDTHDLGGAEPQRFAPDFAMAQSWQRLINGTPEPHDITLLHHEIMENELMNQGLSQDEAHRITSQKYNYAKESNAFYGTPKKHKNK